MVSYSAHNPWAEDRVFPMALERGVGVIAMAVARDFASAGLASRAERCARSMRHAFGSLSDPRTFLRQCRGALSQLQKPPFRLPPDFAAAMPGLAYVFAASPEAVSCVLSGTVNPTHLEQNVAAVLGARITGDVRSRLLQHARSRK